MSPIRVMVNGLPGNMALTAARHVIADPRFELVPWALTGPEITAVEHAVEGTTVGLIPPGEREARMAPVIARFAPFISVDYSHPAAVNANAAFYCRQGLPFVMGTTGGDRAALAETVRNSSTAAVIAPNMAAQIVGFQAMMAYAADHFPGLFRGYRLQIRESHQRGKADTSGTAKAMVGYFNRMGVPFSADQITMERDPAIQREQWGIAPEHLAGHAWHTYTLTSEDGTVRFEFTHNVNGREVYARGTLDAVAFLARRPVQDQRGRVFSMLDVLGAGGG